ncbi:MAG: cell division protein FtsQ/DivIB [Salinivenus sp.]
MNWDQARTYGRRTLRLLGLAAVGALVVALGVMGWQWRAGMTVGEVRVGGVQHAPPDTLRHLAQVDSGATLSSVDAALVADRVERHPWVEEATITKQYAWRTLHVEVTERTPAALALNPDGRPAYYVDSTGHALPLPDSTSDDVPLVRGLPADVHPVEWQAPPRLRSVLTGLAESEAEPIVSELIVQPDSSVHLRTTPVGEHEAVPVRLSPGDPEPQLRELRAFATQVLATRPEAPIAEIDLRFDGQIVTREQPLDPS